MCHANIRCITSKTHSHNIGLGLGYALPTQSHSLTTNNLTRCKERAADLIHPASTAHADSSACCKEYQIMNMTLVPFVSHDE